MTDSADSTTTAPPKRKNRSRGFWGEAWHNFRQRKLAMLALIIVATLGLVAVFSPAIAGTRPIVCKYKGKIYFPCMRYYHASWENPVFSHDKFRKRYVYNLKEKDPESWAIWPLVHQDPYRRTYEGEWPGQPANPIGGEGKPNRYNLFGTNQQGYDVFAMIVHGTRTALLVGFVSMSIASAIGIAVGACAGYYRGWVDVLLSRGIEVMMCIPTLVLILTLLAVVECPTIWHTMAVIGATGWTGIARLTRAEFMKLGSMEFVMAARAMGAPQRRTMFRHMLPNALAPILVPITFGIAGAIMYEAALSLLGFGAPSPSASWGSVLNSGTQNTSLWWLTFFPGAAIFLAVLAYNLIGEGIQEATDPRLKQGVK